MGADWETVAVVIATALVFLGGLLLLPMLKATIMAVVGGGQEEEAVDHVPGVELRKRMQDLERDLKVISQQIDTVKRTGATTRSAYGGPEPAWESRAEDLSAQIRKLQDQVRHLEGRVGAAVHNFELQTRPSASSRGAQEVARAPLIPTSLLAGSNSAQGDGAIGGAAAGSGRAAGGSGFVGHERRPTQDLWALVARALREAWERACKDGRLDDAHFRREVEVMQGFRAHRREGNFAYVDFEVNRVERQYLLPTRTESYHATERYECTDTDRDAFIVGLDRLAYREGEAWHPGLARTSRST